MFLQIAALMLPTRIAARVGSSIADAGVYAAIEIADITRMRDGLSKVGEAIQLGRRTVRVNQANVLLALGVKGVFLLLPLTCPRASCWRLWGTTARQS